MATKSQEILLKGNTTNASAVPSSLKVREIAINALDRSLFTNDGNSIVKLYTGTTKWFDVNGNANNALKLGGILASEYINKEAFNSHINNSTIHITADERTAWDNKWDYNEETIKAVKVNAAVNADVIAKTYSNQSINFATGESKIRLISNNDVNGGSNGFPSQYVGGISAISDYLGWQMMTDADNTVPNPFFRKVDGKNNWTTWKQLAFLTDNVASATKLATARKIWGKPFDGSADVSGDLTNVGNISASGKATIQGDIISGGEVVAVAGEGTPAGVTDYSALTGKPSINGVTLVSGNNTLASLGIQAAGDYATNSGVTTLLANYADKTFVSNNYVSKSAFNNHTADTDIHVTSSDRMYWNSKWDFDDETIKVVKVNEASSADKLTVNAGTSAIPIYFDGGIPVQCIPSDLFSGFDNAYSSSGEHSLGITIAGYTKMVVVAYSQTAGSVAWSGITGKPSTFTPSAHTHTASDVSGLPTSLKNPYALSFGSKTYDGSAAATITASDLGALTAHQSIYAFTLQVNGTSKGVYNPASAAKTINIAVPTKTSDITNDSGFITSASIPTALKNPYAVEIKANGVSLGTYDGSAAETFNLSAANVGAANKVHSHTASEISGLPTNLSAFTNDIGYITGITKSMVEGVLTGDITSHTHSYLPLSGGTISGILTIKANGYPLIEFKAGDTTYGYYGFSKTGVAAIWDTKNWQTLLHSGNYNSYTPTLTGTGASGTWGISITGNAATVGGLSVTSGNSKPWGTIPAITDGGYMDVGQHFEFHYDNTTGSDYSTLLACTGNYGNQVYLPSATGTLALTTDNVASATKLATSRSINGTSFNGLADITTAQWGAFRNIYISDATGTNTGGAVRVNGSEDFTLKLPATIKADLQGNASTATTANTINIFIHSPITTSAAGWYRIAYYPTRDTVRGLTEFQIYTTGGNAVPIVNTIRINGGWALASINHCIIDGLRTNIGDIRTTYDDTNIYLEFYCVKEITAYLRVLRNNASVGTVNETWRWYTGALPEGGGTVANEYDGYILFAKESSKLSTSRSIWGQSFDGTGNVSGDLSMVRSKIYWNNDINNYYIGWNNSEYAFDFVNYYGHRFYSGNSERLRITKKGNVLIGTTADNGYKLDVNGRGHYSGDLIVDGEVSALVA